MSKGSRPLRGVLETHVTAHYSLVPLDSLTLVAEFLIGPTHRIKDLDQIFVLVAGDL